MPAKSLPTIDALIICRDCRRFLVVTHGDIKFTMEDDNAQAERSAVELLDIYCASYQAELLPHLTKVTKLRALALAIRKATARPNLP